MASDPSQVVTLDPTWVLRPLQASDMQEVRDLHAQSFPLLYENSFYAQLESGTYYSLALVNELANPGERIIGCVTAELIPATEVEDYPLLKPMIWGEQRVVAYILTLAVTEKYRRHGIASRLLYCLIDDARQNCRCKAIYLHTEVENSAAKRFYTKFQFQRLRTLTAYYEINGEAKDAALYILYLHGAEAPPWLYHSILGMLCRLAAAFRGSLGLIADTAKSISLEKWQRLHANP